MKKALDLPVPSDSPSAAAFLSSRNREAEFGYRDLVHLTQLLDEDCVRLSRSGRAEAVL